MYSGKDIPAAAQRVTLLWPHDLSPVHSWNSYQSDFSKTHTHFFHLLLKNCWVDWRMKSMPPGTWSSSSLFPGHFFTPLKYNGNEDLPFQWHLLLHNFSLEVLMFPLFWWQIYLVLKTYLNSTTGLHVATKAHQCFVQLFSKHSLSCCSMPGKFYMLDSL